MNMTKNNTTSPLLSIIVIFHNMCREAQRTLYTLCTDYQLDLSHQDYEVIAIDNGSDEPLTNTSVQMFGPNFKYHFLETDSMSPAGAINYGVSLAVGKFVAVIVDGARMLTPGLVRESLRALQAYSSPFVCALAWHLGPDVQNLTILEGYDQEREDQLLDSINWRKNGYGLFDISTLAQSSSKGFLGGMPSECSWFAIPRSDFVEMGGYDERFQSPGGGLVNHDFISRILTRCQYDLVVILGEGSFHQVHGGVATNVPLVEHPLSLFKAEYQRIHNKPYHGLNHRAVPNYLGSMPVFARKFLSKTVLN